jgi:tRNA(Ile)-lysidine synthase
MASSRKPASASAQAFLLAHRGRRIAVALSGGLDSVVLLHLLKDHPGVCAVHVHHGLSPNADAWAAFCRRLCKQWAIPISVFHVRVKKAGKGLEAAAREARYAAFGKLDGEMIALAHHLDDQAETVLMNLLRGAGVRGAAGMRPLARFEGKLLARPLLEVPRAHLEDHARRHGLEWVEDESNADESLTRNFVRRRLGPLIETRFPQWKRALARAARHFAGKELGARELLREFLASKNLQAPSEAKLIEMLRQLTSGGAGTRLEHDGRRLRVYRGRVVVDARAETSAFAPMPWKGERRLKVPALGGELRFHAGAGIAARHVKAGAFEIRLRSGGERLQVHPRRPRRTLKNLFQEAGVPSWARLRMPLLFCGKDLVWAPGLGVDVRYQGRGLRPEWIAENA